MSTQSSVNQEPLSRPTPDVWPPAPASVDTQPLRSDVPEFKRQNVALLLVLYLGTLGIYGLFWINRQMKVVNRRLDPPPMSPIAFWILVGMTLFYITISLLRLPDDTRKVIGWTTNVAWWVMFFNLRSALNRIFVADPEDHAYSNKIGTFFLGLVYLQHKINVYLCNRPLAHS